MEKFRIALYGISQVTAIAYGVLVAGTIVKVSHAPEEQIYNGGMFYRDYGFYLLLSVVAWAVATAYGASGGSKKRLDENAIALSGPGLTVLYAIAGTIFALAGLSPQHLLVHQ